VLNLNLIGISMSEESLTENLNDLELELEQLNTICGDLANEVKTALTDLKESRSAKILKGLVDKLLYWQ